MCYDDNARPPVPEGASGAAHGEDVADVCGSELGIDELACPRGRLRELRGVAAVRDEHAVARVHLLVRDAGTDELPAGEAVGFPSDRVDVIELAVVVFLFGRAGGEGEGAESE